MPASADSKNKRRASGSPVTHQTVQQQGGTGEDGHVQAADQTLSVAAIEKKKSWTGQRFVCSCFRGFIMELEVERYYM